MFQTALFIALFGYTQALYNEPAINIPQYLTTHPAEDYMPHLSKDGRLMVFVSTRAGAPNVWVKTISSGEIRPALRLTRGVSGEKSPKISPDGKMMVYVSYETDAEGDIYLLNIKNVGKDSEFKETPRRLTGISTADKEPAFSVDGKSIIFTSRDKKGSKENLWLLNIKTGERRQLTYKGGRLAAVAPDGENVVFVSDRGSMKGALYMLGLASQKVKPVTRGEWIDSFPAYIDERRVVFIRYVDDTNGDGAVTIDDNPSLFALDITRPGRPPVPLTSSERYNLFPTVNSGYIYFAAKEKSVIDIYRIPVEGVLPPAGSLEKDIEKARSIERFYPGRPALSLLAWRMAWSANYGDEDHVRLAQTLFRQAMLLKQGGAYFLADKVLSRLIALYKDAPRYHGLARIEKINLLARMKRHSIKRVVISLAKIAREDGAPMEVEARAKIEMASWLIKGRRQGEGLKILRQVVADYGSIKSIAAEAAFKRSEIYSIAGDREKQLDVYLSVIRDYPGETEWTGKARLKIVELNVEPKDFRKSRANLTNIIENYRGMPALQAAAMNKIAEMYYDDNELARARETFALTLGRFPDEEKAKNHALFRIAEIYAEEENYGEALKTYRTIERDTEIKKDVYLKTRKDFIQKSLRKGWYELALKEIRIALKTFKSVIEYDPSVIEAYRGLIACRARLGEMENAVQAFESDVAGNPGSQVYLYSLGLALTYLDPPPLDRSAALIKSALAKNERSPWYHQTLGWIYEQKGRKSDDSDLLELAMNEYSYAFTLTDEKSDPKRRADLRLNLGNVNYFLKNYAEAKNDYKARKISGVKFQSNVQEALFHKRWGEVEYKLGNDKAAIKNYHAALALSKDENMPVKIELYERLGLSHQSAREYQQAAQNFMESLKLRRAIGLTDNETVILRNIANNLFFLSESEKEKDRQALREALDYYRESEKALKGYKNREKASAAPLFSMEVTTGVGGLKGASKGFSEVEERKLIFHHIGRIYGELHDYENAIRFFEKKLKLTPATGNVLDNVPMLTEKAIILNQLGFYQYKLKSIEKAKARFLESLDICHTLKSATCMITNADNLERLAIEYAGVMAAKDIDEIMARCLEALGEAKENEPAYNTEYGAALNHLAHLYHNRFLRSHGAPERKGAKAQARFIKANAADLAIAEDLYEEARGVFVKMKSANALVAGLDISLNMATLFYDKGDVQPALDRLDETEKMAGAYGLGEIEWKAMFLKYRFDPSNSSGKLAQAAMVLENLSYGAYPADNRRFTLAMIRSLYHELALKAGNKLEEISILERGRAAALKLALSGIFREKFSDEEIKGIEKLRELYARRAKLASEQIALGGEEGEARAGPLLAWKNEYDSHIESLQETNPLLADVAGGGKFDMESVLGSLDEGEAAIFLWRSGDIIKLFIVTQKGVSSKELRSEREVLNTLESDSVFEPVSKIYYVTNTPFSDPLATRIAQSYQVASIPSLSSLYHFKSHQSLNDFRLVAFGTKSKALESAKDNFLEARFVRKDEALKAVGDGALSSAGLLVFGSAPDVSSVDPVRISFLLAKGPALPARLPFKKLVSAKSSGVLIVTPPMPEVNGYDWEGAVAYLALFSGFSSWVIVPEEAVSREEYYKSLLAGSKGSPVAPYYGVAEGKARLIGSFGLSSEERLAKAKTQYKKRIRAGVAAMKKEDWARAADQFERALRYTGAAGEKKYDRLLLEKLSEIEFTRGDFKKALLYREKLNTIFKNNGNQDKLADSYLLTGIIQIRLKQNNRAVINMERALEIYRETGSVGKMASTLSKMGIAQERFSRYGEALSQYRAALKINRAAGDEERAAIELMRIGRIYHLRLNRFVEGRETYLKALKIFEKIGDSRQIAMTLIDMGALDVDAGALSRASTMFNRAIKIATDNKDMKAQALAQFHLANVHWFRGEYEHAFASIRKSIKEAKSINDPGLVLMSQNTLGLVYLTLNDYPKAMESLDSSLGIARAIGSRLDEATSLSNIGLVYRKMGKLAKALDYFKKALLIDEELKSDWGMAHSARNLSITYLRMGKYEMADTLAREAVDLTEKIGDRISAARSVLQLADVMAQKEGRATALAMYRKAAKQADKAQVKEVLWRALRGAGRALKAKGDSSGAIEAYKKAVDLVEGMRASIKSDFLKQGYLDDKQELYEELILLLLDKNVVSEAFIYSERSRARGFIDLMGMSKIRFNDKQAQKAYDKATDLKRKLDELDVSIASGAKNKKLMKERRVIEDDYTRTLEWLRQKAPDVLPFVAVEPIDPARLLELVGDDAVLFEYVMTANELVIFVIGDGKIEARRVPATKKEITGLVTRYRKLIQDRAPIGDEATRLGRILIEPVLPELGAGKTLGIVPHGALHYLSFASIQVNGEYLVDKTPLFYLPAASILEYTINRRKVVDVKKAKVLAIGNPDLGNMNTDLPLAELEARSIRWVYPNIDIYTRGEATESRVLKDTASFNIVHIASHGQFDPVNPLRSSLILAADTKNDGALQASEVFSLDMKADIVTLSACQTGLGKVTGGDEVVGMNRAFLFAGAHTILSTLWRVDDMASAILVKHFYRNLPHTSKAMALRKAQLTIKRSFGHPAFWAGFTLVGDFK